MQLRNRNACQIAFWTVNLVEGRINFKGSMNHCHFGCVDDK